MNDRLSTEHRPLTLGILMIDGLATCLPGSIANSASYGVSVVYRKVPGATGARVLAGDESLTSPLAQAARELVREGAEGISSNCGFAALYQPALARAVTVPVFVSSLLQVPLVAATLPAGRKVGILTFDAEQLGDRQFRAVGWDPERIPVSVAGVRGLPAWEVLANPEGAIDPEAMWVDLRRVAEGLCRQDPTIAALVLECTAMCPFAPTLQATLERPVFDLNSLIHYMLRALRYPAYQGVVPPPTEAGLTLADVRAGADLACLAP
jgi:hypothetical protein